MTVRPNTGLTATVVDNADVTVVGGAGHIGIPLVLALAEAGLRVNVNDINQANLDALMAGGLPYIEYGGDRALTNALNNSLVFTNSPDRISTVGPVVVTVGIPAGESSTLTHTSIQDCIDAILPSLLTAGWSYYVRR